MIASRLEQLVDLWLEEDCGRAWIDPQSTVCGEEVLESEGSGVWCGGWLIANILNRVCINGVLPARVNEYKKEGERFSQGAELARIRAPIEALRHGNRVVLNILGHLSAVAENTRQLTDRVARWKTVILDTRKTTPGLRELEKYAARVGGGRNHRFGRDDGVLIKKEDKVFDGGVMTAIERAFREKPHLTNVEVEVCSLDELDHVAHDKRIKYLLLDNFSIKDIKTSVERYGATHVLEASGVNIDELEKIAATGVPYISTSVVTTEIKRTKMHMTSFRIIPYSKK